MAWEWIGQLGPALVPVATTIFGLSQGQGRLRRNLRHDAEVLKELPEGSKARSELQLHLEWQIMRLRESESEGQRNWFGFGVGLTLAVGLGYLAVFLFSEDGWWRWFGVLALVGALFGSVGIFASLIVEKRTWGQIEKGKTTWGQMSS